MTGRIKVARGQAGLQIRRPRRHLDQQFSQSAAVFATNDAISSQPVLRLVHADDQIAMASGAALSCHECRMLRRSGHKRGPSQTHPNTLMRDTMARLGNIARNLRNHAAGDSRGKLYDMSKSQPRRPGLSSIKQSGCMQPGWLMVWLTAAEPSNSSRWMSVDASPSHSKRHGSDGRIHRDAVVSSSNHSSQTKRRSRCQGQGRLIAPNSTANDLGGFQASCRRLAGSRAVERMRG